MITETSCSILYLYEIITHDDPVGEPSHPVENQGVLENIIRCHPSRLVQVRRAARSTGRSVPDPVFRRGTCLRDTQVTFSPQVFGYQRDVFSVAFGFGCWGLGGKGDVRAVSRLQGREFVSKRGRQRTMILTPFFFVVEF